MSLRSEGIQTQRGTSVRETQTGLGESELREMLKGMDREAVLRMVDLLKLRGDDPVEVLVGFARSLDAQVCEVLIGALRGDYADEQIVQLLEGPRMLNARFVAMFDLGFRYRCSEFVASVVYGPQFVGAGDFVGSVSLNLRGEKKKRVLIQSICASGQRFPESLTIVIDDRETLMCRKNDVFVDITNHVVGKGRVSVELRCGRETQWFCIAIRHVTKLAYEELLEEVTQKKLPTSEYAVCCPISRKVMRVPVRSLKCTHNQCCDLKALLKTSDNNGRLTCPVCRMDIGFQDLAVDLVVMERLSKKRLDCVYCRMKDHEH